MSGFGILLSFGTLLFDPNILALAETVGRRECKDVIEWGRSCRDDAHEKDNDGRGVLFVVPKGPSISISIWLWGADKMDTECWACNPIA